jgi:hypothetical protein
MGLSPRDIGAMSLWEFACVADAWRAAHGGEDAALSDGEVASLSALIDGQG